MRRTVPSSLSSLFGRCFGGAAVARSMTMLVALVGVMSTGCENKGIGRPCEVSGDAANQMSGVGLNTALECPSRLCILPSQGVASVDTKPFCTAECSDDSDCDDGEKRSKNPGDTDKRCVQGFTCMVPFETGSLCCKKLCVCRDFLPANYKSSSALPKTCEKSVSSCQNL